MAGDLQPLDEKFQIVGPDGRPTLYFIEWAQQRQIDITAGITLQILEEYLAAHPLQEGDGIALTPSGNLADSPSISVRNGTGLNFDGMQNLKIADTAVTPGTYGDATNVGQFTVDQQGRITAASNVAISGGGGGGSTFTKYVVATAGDAFIDIPLDSDNGYAYEFFIKGAPSANSTFNFRISDDNGATFKAGATDYKSGGSSGVTSVALTGTVGSGRQISAKGIITGLNVVATEDFNVVGYHQTISSTGVQSAGNFSGAKNSLAASNWNAFQILCSAGNMDGMAVYVKKAY